MSFPATRIIPGTDAVFPCGGLPLYPSKEFAMHARHVILFAAAALVTLLATFALLAVSGTAVATVDTAENMERIGSSGGPWLLGAALFGLVGLQRGRNH
jgi:hypothetical protein